MSNNLTESNVTLQDRSLDFSKVKTKHSQVFSNLEKKGNKFMNFSLYRDIPVYFHEKLNQTVYLR